MVWVKFTQDFSYRQPSFTIAYKEGMVKNVVRDCADKAVAQGRAEKLPSPVKAASGEVVHGDQGKNDGARSPEPEAPADSA